MLQPTPYTIRKTRAAKTRAAKTATTKSISDYPLLVAAEAAARATRVVIRQAEMVIRVITCTARAAKATATKMISYTNDRTAEVWTAGHLVCTRTGMDPWIAA